VVLIGIRETDKKLLIISDNVKGIRSFWSKSVVEREAI